MNLPAAERALIEPAKVRDYLLAREHPVGRFKAMFFESLGYSAGAWQQLEADLRGLAAAGEATLGEQTKYGQKYEVHGSLSGPSGKRASVVTVWIIRWGEEAPRFVTAFPGGKT
ncbi:MAG: adhesin [Deltaproteobacteria bacterium]|nr:adhesin [Deltaproteobacteria bacterium]